MRKRERLFLPRYSLASPPHHRWRPLSFSPRSIEAKREPDQTPTPVGSLFLRDNFFDFFLSPKIFMKVPSSNSQGVRPEIPSHGFFYKACLDVATEMSGREIAPCCTLTIAMSLNSIRTNMLREDLLLRRKKNS